MYFYCILSIIPTISAALIRRDNLNWQCSHLIGKCFAVVETQTNVTWVTANNYCVQQDGYLASIHSQNEETFLLDLVSNRTRATWIGLHTLDKNTFSWVDSSDYDFTNWAPHEPNGRGFEPCVHMYTQTSTNYRAGQWNDETCSSSSIKAYICQKDGCVGDMVAIGGNLTYSQKPRNDAHFPFDTIATLQCSDRCAVSQPEQATCTHTGNFDSQLQCVQKGCPALMVPGGSEINYSTMVCENLEYAIGTVATIMCTEQCTKEQPSEATCTSNGTWSNQLHCINDGCVPLNSSLINYAYSSQQCPNKLFPTDTIVNTTCDEKCYDVHPPQAKCLESGVFDGYPKCFNKGCQQFGVFFGDVTFDTAPCNNSYLPIGTTASITCDNGQASTIITCTETLGGSKAPHPFWDGTVIKCEEPTCDPTQNIDVSVIFADLHLEKSGARKDAAVFVKEFAQAWKKHIEAGFIRIAIIDFFRQVHWLTSANGTTLNTILAATRTLTDRYENVPCLDISLQDTTQDSLKSCYNRATFNIAERDKRKDAIQFVILIAETFAIGDHTAYYPSPNDQENLFRHTSIDFVIEIKRTYFEQTNISRTTVIEYDRARNFTYAFLAHQDTPDGYFDSLMLVISTLCRLVASANPRATTCQRDQITEMVDAKFFAIIALFTCCITLVAALVYLIHRRRTSVPKKAPLKDFDLPTVSMAAFAQNGVHHTTALRSEFAESPQYEQIENIQNEFNRARESNETLNNFRISPHHPHVYEQNRSSCRSSITFDEKGSLDQMPLIN